MRLLALALLAVSSVGCTDSGPPDPSASESSSVPGPGAPSDAPDLPALSDDSRWLGVNGLMIAVPDSWKVTQDVCSRSNRAIVFHDPTSSTYRCPAYGREVATLTVYDNNSVQPFGRLRPRGAVHGLDVSASMVGCRTSRPPICSLSFAVADSDVMFSVTFRAMNALKVIEDMRDSIRPVPTGFSAVPFIHYGWSVKKAKAQLKAAGLEGQSEDVDWPHYVTAARPAPGTVLEQGTESPRVSWRLDYLDPTSARTGVSG